MSKILIISHANEREGAIDRFEEYLLSNNRYVSKLTHPLDDYSKQKTFFSEQGNRRWSLERRQLGPINLVQDLWYSSKTILKVRPDVVIGANNFDTFSALLLLWVGLLRKPKVIYFASDLSEDRFGSGALNRIYTVIERACLKHADFTVSNTHRAASKREGMGLPKNKSVIVPNAATLTEEVPQKPLSKDAFIFVGALNKEHGLLDFLTNAKLRIRELHVIGDGEERNGVEAFCQENRINLKLTTNVSHEEAMNRMARFSGIGLAPYQLTSTSKYIYYGSSLKLYEYIACGLPVITSNTTEQADDILHHQLGVVYAQYQDIQAALDGFAAAGFSQRTKEYSRSHSSAAFYKRVPV
jgi:glycosyltransferase involved in cell wall biosynthesis